ncbi:DUF805 domain-containing protein [Algoriphagus mannitolivorans]|uniref:DUF805 domain-containing protein n=1 Tax=Algoriphagus mannitolivorans TaxID=226504 RepID=UPI00047E7548|nr:DUF805 domain-containing protein [Algoriphagus mannitolivorans]
MEYYLEALRKFNRFSGRSRRKEFWIFGLFYLLFIFLAVFLDTLLGITFDEESIVGPIYLLVVMVHFIPSLAVSVRRLHDTGRSGWWYFISLIPILGSIILFVFLCLEGNPGPNNYGKDPKAAFRLFEIEQ